MRIEKTGKQRVAVLVPMHISQGILLSFLFGSHHRHRECLAWLTQSQSSLCLNFLLLVKITTEKILLLWRKGAEDILIVLPSSLHTGIPHIGSSTVSSCKFKSSLETREITLWNTKIEMQWWLLKVTVSEIYEILGLSFFFTSGVRLRF